MPNYTVPALEYAAPTYSTRKFDKDDSRELADYKLGTLTSPSKLFLTLLSPYLFEESTKSRLKTRNSRRSQTSSIIGRAPDFV